MFESPRSGLEYARGRCTAVSAGFFAAAATLSAAAFSAAAAFAAAAFSAAADIKVSAYFFSALALRVAACSFVAAAQIYKWVQDRQG